MQSLQRSYICDLIIVVGTYLKTERMIKLKFLKINNLSSIIKN